MQKGLLMKRMAYLLLLVLPFVAAACSGATPAAQVVEVTRIAPQTVVVTEVVTEVVTQIVTQPAPEPTKALTPDAPTPKAPQGGYASPTPPIVYTYFDNCPYSRLKVGKEAYVTYGGGANAIRGSATTAQENNILGYADEGDTLAIIGGPVCDYGMLLWQVRTSDGVEGWTPEGNGDKYYLLPTK